MGEVNLHTLKDLEELENGNLDVREFVDELKAEAVKWVKNFENENDFVPSWIKTFFNLTEEDLKDE